MGDFVQLNEASSIGEGDGQGATYRSFANGTAIQNSEIKTRKSKELGKC